MFTRLSRFIPFASFSVAPDSSKIVLKTVLPKVGNQRLVGRVVSDKMQRTVLVRVDHRVWNNKYHRFIVRRKKFFAHDQDEACTPGDIVAIEQSQKRSKHKHFEVTEILKPINS